MLRATNQMVTVYQPDIKWLSDNAHSAADLLLICDDGRVPVHSALLAGSSQLVASLLSDHRTCSGCREPLNLHLVGTTVADCSMLVSLLYTGLAPLRGPGVDHVLRLAAMLGLDLPGLQVQNADASLLVCDPPALGVLQYQVPPSVSRVCPRVPSPSFPNNELSDELLVSDEMSDLSAGDSCKLSSVGDSCKLSSVGDSCKLSSVGDGCPTFPTTLSDLSDEFSDLSAGDSKPANEQPGKHSVEQGRVELPNGILEEVLRVKSSIKLEVEDELDPLEQNWMEVEDEFNLDWMASCPRLEGREHNSSENGDSLCGSSRRLSGTSDASTSDKDPRRNFVCKHCNTGFRFARSYRWHRDKCRQEKIKLEENNSKEVATDGIQKKVKHCKLCEKSFIGKSLKMHYINFHFKQKIESDYLDSRDKSRKCPICKSSFKKSGGLITHIGYVHKAYLKYLREHEKLTNAMNALKGRKVSCGECSKCKMDNCGKCAYCQDKLEFGGPGKLLKVCVRKVCRNKRVSEAVIKPTLVRKNFIDKKR